MFLDKTRRKAWHPHYQKDFKEWLENDYALWRKDWENAFGRHPSDYSVLFSYACPDSDSRQGYIENLISGCEPGAGYIYLSSLALANYFHTFITTNFDDLIHDALFRYGGLKPVVSAFDSQVASMRLPSPRPKIIKLHGDFLYNNIRNVGPELSHLDRNMEEKFERTCESYGLVVIGYSGQDHSVMAPLRGLLHKRDRLTHGLHWCVYTPDNERARNPRGKRQIPEELYRMWDAYPDKVHLYDVGSFDQVMEAFYAGGNCSPPPDLAHPEEKALYSRLRDGLENADQTWRLLPEFDTLLESFREASSRRPPNVVGLLDEADQSHRQGRYALNEKNYKNAHAEFGKSVAKAEEAAALAEDGRKVRALRRLSGSRSNLATVLFEENGQTEASKLPPEVASKALEHAKKALAEIREGLELDRKLTSPSDLRGHRVNLLFNGLICYGFLQQIEPATVQENHKEALTWLERMTSDELGGEEYVQFLCKDEIGGQELFNALCPEDAKDNARTVRVKPKPEIAACEEAPISLA